jgi:thimet oligopeptidase
MKQNKNAYNKVIDQSIYSFPKWTVQKIQNIPDSVCAQLQARVTILLNINAAERTFENTVFAIESLGYGVSHQIALLDILMNLSPKENIRLAAQQAGQEYEKKAVDIMYDVRLYTAFKEYYTGSYKSEKKSLALHEIKLVEDMYIDFKNQGFELSGAIQKKYKSILKKIAVLESQFRFNINATNTHITCTEAELAGLPRALVLSLEKDEKEKYKIPTDGAVYISFMKFATNPVKRKEIMTLALQKGGKKNIVLLSNLTKLRHEAAVLLGYTNHIDKTLSNRMAQNEKTAVAFITGLYKRVEKKHNQEKRVLDEYKTKETGTPSKADFYDISYYSNKVYEQLAALDTETLKEYFECNNTVQGMLDLYSNLLGITFEKTLDIPVWEKSVTVLKISDTKSKEIIGYIYMDLYPRTGKYSHAMVTHATNGYRIKYQSDEYMMPICALVCNFSLPNKHTPSLLSLRDVETLFHEFGHALHTVLTRVDFESQSGTNVTWDFVEAPSQMLENFVYEARNLKRISKHYITGKSLDSHTIRKIRENKNFINATYVARQILLCLFDFEIHKGNAKQNIVETYNSLYHKVTGNTLPQNTYFPAGFGHMAGYDSAYYSYMWALVYAQDIYAKFATSKNTKERKAIGMQYRKKILEVGSSRGEMDSIVDFLGRKPNNKAFLESQGI